MKTNHPNIIFAAQLRRNCNFRIKFILHGTLTSCKYDEQSYYRSVYQYTRIHLQYIIITVYKLYLKHTHSIIY